MAPPDTPDPIPSPTTYTPAPRTPQPAPAPSGDHASGNPGLEIHHGGDDAGSLPKAASYFMEEATDLPLDIQRKLMTIGDLGDFIGGDSIGRKFRPGYEKAALNAVEYVNALALAYGRISTKLTQMATNMKGVEWVNTVTLPKVSDGPTFSTKDGTVTP